MFNMKRFFTKKILRVSSMNPDGSVKEDILEIRKDPLTGHVARINVSRAKRPHVRSAEIPTSESERLRSCPFCEKNWGRVLQGYDRAIWNDRFMKEGHVLLFPNKYPFGKHHSVLILGGKHESKLGNLGMGIWISAFRLMKKYVDRVMDYEGWEKAYPYLNLNFMYPAGASIDHPHMQILVEKNPLSTHSVLLKESRKFYKKHSRSYWDVLEKKCSGNLRIGKGKVLSLMASFAPVANGEIFGTGIKKPFRDYRRDETESLAFDIGKIIRALEIIGWRSMNMTLMFPGSRDESEYFPSLLRIIKRPDPQALYTADRGFIEVFYGESVIQIMPEEIASSLRDALRENA